MSTEMITAEDVVIQSEGFLVSDMDGEKVMLSIDNGKYYNLGHIGGRIWELLSAPTTIAAMVEQLVSEYEIDREACEQQIQFYLRQLAAEGLVQVVKP